MRLRLRAIEYLAENIGGFEFVDPGGGDLPPFTAGAHIDVTLGNGLVRQYSLCNDPFDRRRYYIAVLREPKSRGGSQHLHEAHRIGDLLEVSPPRNFFPLAESAQRHLFLAGGIGITPIRSMIAVLRRSGAPFRLYYCTRDRECTAFHETLMPLVTERSAVIHHDGGDPNRGLEFTSLLRERPQGCHLYHCGPPGFMQAVAAAASHWPADAVHCEYFSPPSDGAPRAAAAPFKIKLASTGIEYDVGGDESIVATLRRHGVEVSTSCEDGYCGTCMTHYVGGEPEHRDHVLDAETRKRYVLICCARSKTPVLELDL